MSPSSRPNIFSRIFRFLWRGLTLFRLALTNLIFIGLIVLVVSAVMQNAPKPIADNTPLFIAPSGVLVDQLSYQSPTDELLNLNNSRPTETLTRELIETIDHAGQNKKINGLILKLDYLSGGGMSKLTEVGAAIERFKAQGKPVIAYADSYSQSQYYLASYADQIYLNDMGAVLLSGFSVYRSYYKKALDKLAVDFHVFKVGKFKDFVEPYIRNDMSEESREHNKMWLEELWSHYTQSIENRRELDEGGVNAYINNANSDLKDNESDTARLALNKKLVDYIGSRIGRNEELIKRFGKDKDNDQLFKHVHYFNYRQLAFPPMQENNGNIGLIVAKGRILDGSQPEGSIGGDSLARLLQKAHKDDDIKALVIRVDSPGGSAFASEVIRQEIVAIKDSGKAIFISMGSVAASGGYWMSMPANEVWATPTTITGSIGVFGLMPTIDKTLAKLGINNDGVATTDLAGALSIERPLSPKMGELLQLSVESMYDKFITLVADSRGMDKKDVHEYAQGRVWTGIKAKELGLVDELGNLDQVVAAAAAHVNIDKPKVKIFERELSPQEQIMKLLSGQASAFLYQQVESSKDLRAAKKLFMEYSAAFDSLEPLINSKPNQVHAHCLHCMAP